MKKQGFGFARPVLRLAEQLSKLTLGAFANLQGSMCLGRLESKRSHGCIGSNPRKDSNSEVPANKTPDAAEWP